MRSAEAEYRFHHCLIEGAQNQFAAHVYGVIETALSTFVSPLFLDAASHVEALEDHRALTNAVVAGDPAAARGAIERLGHLRRRNLRRALRSKRTDKRAASR